jgi:O-acetyl-ADP-ribose deacetylase (regulator of RNase III)
MPSHYVGIAGAIVSKGGQIIQQQSNEIIKKLGGPVVTLNS